MEKWFEKNDIDKNSSEAAQYMQLASLAVGAAVGGTTGASTALAATQNNWLKHREYEELKASEAAYDGGSAKGCDRANELRALDKQRDRDYAAYAESVLKNMREEGVPINEESFSARMEGYWRASGVSRRDVIYPEGGHIPSYPTSGQELYALLGRLAESLPDWYPGKGSAELSAQLLQGILEQGGETIAAWRDLFKPGQAANWFTGEAVTGVDAWDARFGSGASLIAGILTGGGKNAADTLGNALGKKADDVVDAARNGAGRVEMPNHLLPDNIRGDGLISQLPTLDGKITDQLGRRGWSVEDIKIILERGPVGKTVDSRGPSKTPDGLGRNDSASVFGSRNGYIVINDRTGEVVQVSDKLDPDWIPDGRIKWK